MAKTWKDTVMKLALVGEGKSEWFKKLPDYEKSNLLHQAKATWPTAFEEGRKSRDKEIDEAYQRGRREVVDFVEEHMCNLEEWPGWQEMKEEWGLKECEK